MENQTRKVFLPAKVLQKQQEPFQPTAVIYKPCKRANPPPHPNVLYKIPGSGGKCYEFAFVRSFTRMEAEKFVCCGCRVLKVQNRPGAKGRKVPYVLVSKGMFKANPAIPTNADHFCKPKITVDVLHSCHISSLKKAVLEEPPRRPVEIPETREEMLNNPVVDELVGGEALPPAVESSSLPQKMVDTSENRKKCPYPRIPKFLQNSSSYPVVRFPSMGPRKILFKLPPTGEKCYEFVEKKTRSLYFEVYHCTACSRRKDVEGHNVGPIPAVHLRGEFPMTDPVNPKYPHYCTPKSTSDVILHGHISKILYSEQRKAMNTKEIMNSLRINCPSLMADIRNYEADKEKMLALERKLINRNLAITMSKERAERIAKEDAEQNGQPAETPPPTLEPVQEAGEASAPVSRGSTSPSKTLSHPESRNSSVEMNREEDRPRKQLTLKRKSSSSSLEEDFTGESMPVLTPMEKKTKHFIFPQKNSNLQFFALRKRVIVRRVAEAPRQLSPPRQMLFPVRVMRRE